MSRKVSVRFTHSSGNIDFYDTETMRVDVRRIQETDLFQGINGLPYLYAIKDPYKVIEMDILLDIVRPRVSGTLQRIYDLWNLDLEVYICYYRYGIDTITYPIYVQMYRSGFTKPYFEGTMVRHEPVKLIFIEAVPEGVAVHRKRVGV